MDILPDDLKLRLRDGIVDSVARLTEKMPGGDKTAVTLRARFNSSLTSTPSFDDWQRHCIRGTEWGGVSNL